MFANLTAMQLIQKLICSPRDFYARKKVEKTTPKNDTPETARTMPSLVLDPAVGVEVGPLELPVLLLVDNPDVLEREEDIVPVGRPAKTIELVNVTQLDEGGTRAV